MTTTKSFSDLAKLEWYLVALTNAKTEPSINQSLIKIGVSNEALEEGSVLHSLASKAYADANTTKKNLNEAYKLYNQKSAELEEYFSIDRKKANIAFLNDTFAKNRLELGRKLQQNRLKQFDMAKTFYTALSENTDLHESLSKLGISAEYIAARLEEVSDIDKARASYILMKGISQNTTLVKNDAINTLTKWMTQFFSLSKKALKNEPQLMEAFGLVVKN